MFSDRIFSTPHLLVTHRLLDICGVDLSLQSIRAEVSSGTWWGFLQCGFPQRTLTADLTIHRKGSPLTHWRRLAAFACLQKLNGRLRSEAFVVIIIHLNHGSICTGAKALHFAEREHTIWRSFSLLRIHYKIDNDMTQLRKP